MKDIVFTLCYFVDRPHTFISIDSLLSQLKQKLEAVKSGTSDYLSNLNKLQKICVQAIAQHDEETTDMVKEIRASRDKHVSNRVFTNTLSCQKLISGS